MSGLDGIPVRIEAPEFDGEDVITGMADALLREIHAHLVNLHERSESHTIDLKGLPLTEADRRQLREALGRGEVSMTVEAAGPTEAYETAYGGVWWIDYQNLLGSTALTHIEIARVPAIAPTHPEDIADALERLGEALNDRKPQTDNPPPD
ncbi:conserved hypothetical protein [Thioalkalivibrio sulfidiphilus HL-EbGr7]|uniref:HupH hydrogenase expression protein C-terminal domain-containing protein n=1 Tax=Thioalkalivibrio sulfidiphilus (strain HL-EbGR7) TaxID=396588 RepID=B8GQG1_THISH|nr:hydrogenase expression/formation protein [Thioalkalivibrio sulfidiphilus]ACL72356.1 conserved hypothetical protein [Thioalkalivibrio sulfidiphilus HL-EbGr7]